jgi:Protein of unknown function (DUF1554)
MSARHVLALALLLSPMTACGLLLGVETLGVEPSDASSPLVVDGPARDVDGARRPEDAGIVDAPPIDASVAKRVFLTSKPLATKGMINGTIGADTLCNTTATDAGLGGTWVAWLSSNERNAIAQLGAWPGPYILVDKTPIVLDRTELVTTGPRHPIDVMEDGKVAIDNEPWVWTGTENNGVKANVRCKDWTDTNPLSYGVAGSFNVAAKWTNNGGAPFQPGIGCNSLGRLYCFEK